ncbi:UNKNOWN [Stylonychia lemnae]|uniref:Uncharacterized protein n=1 Tax=Stylonychia lemnae TaxID=5949 RepID=A0A078BAH6_STYLE|nr:UNKNOWN [Stylonychia lemnae]|eukprot:CDW91560.1 UNKNOWN [Stylonychia lemnae]
MNLPNDQDFNGQNQYPQSQTAQQISRIQFGIPPGASSTASPKRVSNHSQNYQNDSSSAQSNHLYASGGGVNNMNAGTGPGHMKNNSNMYQTTASKYSQDSNSKSSANSAQNNNFIQNQAQNTNKNHLTKKQIHPTHQNMIPQNSAQMVQNQPGSASQNINVFYNNQVTPKNNKRNFQESLQNTLTTSGGVKSGVSQQSVQNSKAKPIFNHNQTIKTNGDFTTASNNVSQSTQVASQRIITNHPVKQQLLLQNIKLKRTQHDNPSFGSGNGLTNIVLDSSGSGVQNYHNGSIGYQEMYSSEQIKQNVNSGISNIDVRYMIPQSVKNQSDAQFSIFAQNKNHAQHQQKNIKIINNLIQEQNMSKPYDKDDKSTSVRQDSSKRSQKTQDRIQNLIDSPKDYSHSNSLQREDYHNNQQLSPQQKALKQEVLQNQQKLFQINNQFIDTYKDQKSSHRSKLMKKNYSLTSNNVKIKSPYNTKLAGNQSNLIKFIHNNNKLQQTIQHHAMGIGFKSSVSNYLQSLNQTQDLNHQTLQNLKHQQTLQLYSNGNPVDMYAQQQLQQLSQENTDTNQYYYQLSNHKRKNQSTDRRHLSSQKIIGRNGVALSKRDSSSTQNNRKQSNNGNNNGSSKKINKKRAQSQVKTPMMQSLDDELHQQQILEQQLIINKLEQQMIMQQQEIEEARQRPETKEIGIDLQTSFEKQRSSKLSLKVKSYRHDLNLFIERLSANSSQEKDKLIEEFQNFLMNLTDDNMLVDPDHPPLRELFKECFKIQNEQIKIFQSQKQTQQNISPSAYEILKQDYDKLQKENLFTKEKLKLAQELSQQQRKTNEQTKKKLEEREQVILLMQETFEKEIENMYTENDIKKFARELNVLYEQNQELHKMNKRMKYELRMAQEREHQFIKIIKKSPELVRMLDMEDSSILDNKVPQYKPKPQEIALVSSKQVPINKLDLDKVLEIQKLQAQGQLPPLEESKIIDKKEMREQVKDMIILDNDSEDETSMVKQEEQNRKKNNNILKGSNGIEYDDEDYGDENQDYDSEGDEDDMEAALYGRENDEIKEIVVQNTGDPESDDYIFMTQQQQPIKNNNGGGQQQHSNQARKQNRQIKHIDDDYDDDL